ncbi:recombinase family protein [Geodermatophilus marinus]|uniref:recombinase family protein n=1 Tax=Geodermatophilus sp. LHW52908 TaxID=2303986 RepID=UPI0013144C3D|nr:recombinase family protein [Geodermatophilus sp. LHW52908]
MSTTRAAIYARQSLDRSGEGAAVDRQVDDCQHLADRRGWTVVETLTDNDMSASTGKRRKGYERLLHMMRGGSVDAVVVWHLDRLTRRLVDLEEVIAICEATGVRLATVTGDIDLSTDTGRMLARILASVARGEVERKGVRQRRANEQRATAGHMGWTRRPFGYDRQDGAVVVVDEEAKGLERAAEMVLSGGTLAAAARMLNDAGLTTTGRRMVRDDDGDPVLGDDGRPIYRDALPWNVTTLRRALLNPRYSGRVTYNGEELQKDGKGVAGQWPIILPADVQERLAEKLRDVRRRVQQGTDVKFLLSGLARCGRCGAVMFASPMGSKGRRWMVYKCAATKSGPGCYLARRQDLVDEVVEAVVVARLSQPDAAHLFAEDEDVPALRAEAAELRSRRDDLAGLLADGLLSASAVRERSGQLTQRINGLEDRISRVLGESPLAVLTAAEDVRAAWEALPLRDRKQVVDMLITVTILPAGKGQRFIPEQVEIEWRRS